MQRVSDELTAGGLASYVPNPDHARSPLVQLTPAGQDTLAAIEEHARQRRLAVAGGFAPAEIATARAVLGKVMAASRTVLSSPRPPARSPQAPRPPARPRQGNTTPVAAPRTP